MYPHALKAIRKTLFLPVMAVVMGAGAAPAFLCTEYNNTSPADDSLNTVLATAANDTAQLTITTCNEEMETVEVYRFIEEKAVFTHGVIVRVGMPSLSKKE